MKAIERLCMAFFILCAIVDGRDLIISGIQYAGWTELDAVGWASWVQAVGSIGAIIGAFMIANHQFRMAEQAQRERELREQEETVLNISVFMLQALRIVEEMYRFRVEVDSVNPGTDSPEDRRFDVANLNDILSVLIDLPMHAINHAEVAIAIMEMRRILVQVRGALESVKGVMPLGTGNLLLAALKAYSEAARRAYNGVRLERDRILNRRSEVGDFVPARFFYRKSCSD